MTRRQFTFGYDEVTIMLNSILVFREQTARDSGPLERWRGVCAKG